MCWGIDKRALRHIPSKRRPGFAVCGVQMRYESAFALNPCPECSPLSGGLAQVHTGPRSPESATERARELEPC